MPNWVTSSFSLQGSRKDIHEFIKLGLVNSGIEPTDSIENDFETLVKEGKTTTPVGDGWGKEKRELTKEVFLSMRTFRPSPETFLQYDTTNYPEVFKEEAEAQKENYGAVGWYDYNRMTLGTKWNAELEHPSLRAFDENPDRYRLDFDLDTAWSFPIPWVSYIQEKFPDILIKFRTDEESNAFNCIGIIQENLEDGLCDYSGIINKIVEWANEKKEVKCAELKQKLDAGEIGKEVYDSLLDGVEDWYTTVVYEGYLDEEDDAIEELFGIINGIEDDFNDLCEIDGSIEQISERNQKALERYNSTKTLQEA